MFGVLARFLATCFGVRLGYTTEVLQEAGKWASPFLGGEKLPKSSRRANCFFWSDLVRHVAKADFFTVLIICFHFFLVASALEAGSSASLPSRPRPCARHRMQVWGNRQTLLDVFGLLLPRWRGLPAGPHVLQLYFVAS